MTYDPPGGRPPPQQPYQPPPMGAPYPATGYGVPGYGYAPPVRPTRPITGLSTAVMILVGLTGASSIFLAIALFHRASLLNDSGILPAGDADDANNRVAVATAFFFLLLVAAGVLWIIWQFRYASNALALRGSLGLLPGWAIGGWFIPFGNYVLPQLQLYQAAKASDPAVPPGQPAASGTAPPILVSWWVLYDLGWVLFGVATSIRPENSLIDPDKFQQADRLSGVSAVLFVVAAVVAIFMVRTLTDRQTRAMAATPAAHGGYQPPYSAPPMGFQPPPPYQPPPPAYQPPPPQWQPPPAQQPPPPPAPPQQWPPGPPPPPQ